MKNLSKPVVFLGVSLAIGVIVLILFIFLRSISQGTPNNLGPQSKLTVKDEATGKSITFGADGFVVYEDENGKLYASWDASKIASLFEYIFANSGEEGGIAVYDENGNLIGYLNPDDELISVIEDEISGGNGGDDGDGGITQYFATPTPVTGVTGGTGGTGGSPAGGGGPSWCTYWKLSFCALVKKITPAPTVSSQGVIYAEDCDQWKAQSDKKTVISGSSCYDLEE